MDYNEDPYQPTSTMECHKGVFFFMSHFEYIVPSPLVTGKCKNKQDLRGSRLFLGKC